MAYAAQHAVNYNAVGAAAAGIIHNVERPEDEHYKQLVSDLAERYMRRPGVVIVCTITCTADIDTQVAVDNS